MSAALNELRPLDSYLLLTALSRQDAHCNITSAATEKCLQATVMTTEKDLKGSNEDTGYFSLPGTDSTGKAL